MNLPIVSEECPPLSPSPEVVIRMEGVSVRYKVPSERVFTFKEYMIRRIQGRITDHEFWALHKVDLEIYKNEVLGIVGKNGAGKSTLLKIVARVLRPTEGRVWAKGRVIPLLELGAGFHSELTGRENIFLNGAILGFSRKEIIEKVPRIIEFSELGDFIDAPLRTYSSGMLARLGFAVATDSQPDILIVDEILGVGDEAFQFKCIERIEQYRKNGATILLVSHNGTLVETMCQRAMWLDHGVKKIVGTPQEVLAAYRQSQI